MWKKSTKPVEKKKMLQLPLEINKSCSNRLPVQVIPQLYNNKFILLGQKTEKYRCTLCTVCKIRIRNDLEIRICIWKKSFRIRKTAWFTKVQYEPNCVLNVQIKQESDPSIRCYASTCLVVQMNEKVLLSSSYLGFYLTDFHTEGAIPNHIVF